MDIDDITEMFAVTTDVHTTIDNILSMSSEHSYEELIELYDEGCI